MRNARAAKGGRLDDGFPLLDIKNILKSASEKVKFRKMTDKKDISEGIYGKKYRTQSDTGETRGHRMAATVLAPISTGILPLTGMWVFQN